MAITSLPVQYGEGRSRQFTVAELIEQLQTMPPETPICFRAAIPDSLDEWYRAAVQVCQGVNELVMWVEPIDPQLCDDDEFLDDEEF